MFIDDLLLYVYGTCDDDIEFGVAEVTPEGGGGGGGAAVQSSLQPSTVAVERDPQSSTVVCPSVALFRSRNLS